MKNLLFLTAAVILFTACTLSRKDGQTNADSSKYLVLYYSQTGTTQTLAKEIAGLLKADTAAFDVETPYNGTFEETIQRCNKERETDSLPAVKIDVDLSGYDVIFLGYPVWFGTYARPVMSLLKEADLKGKTIVPFCTFGIGGLSSSVNDLRAACPEATVADGYGVRAARIDKAEEEVKQFLINGGYIEGEAEELPQYSQQQAVSDEEKEIFDAACGDYPMPIGTPVTAGERTVPHGKDYKFVVNAQTPDGKETEAVVYVTCREGEEPEFTMVER